ncbi:MAG: secretin N-terminal domain-containing protein, partial [Bradymonadia bacterium]
DRTADVQRLNAELAQARAQQSKLQADLDAQTVAANSARAEANTARTEAQRTAQESQARVAAAEQRAQAAEAARRKAETELTRLASQQREAQARITQLEGTQRTLGAQLKKARRNKDATLAARLEAEKKAQSAQIKAEQAEVARLEAAKQISVLESSLQQSRAALARAEQSSQPTADVGKLNAEITQLQARASELRTDLGNRDRAARTAQAQADVARAKAREAAANEALARMGQSNSNPATPGQPVEVQGVVFQDDAKGSTLTIQLSGDAQYTVRKEGRRQRVLEIKGAYIPTRLQQTRPVEGFNSAIQAFSSFQAPPPYDDRVRVVVTLTESVNDTVSRSGSRLVWRFAEPRKVQAPPAVAAFPDTQTSPGLPPAPTWGALPPPAAPQEIGFSTRRAAAYAGTAQLAGTSFGQRARRRRRYSNRRVDIDIKDADIHNILRLLAREGGINIITSDSVKGTVTLHLERVPWDQALEIIAKSKSLGIVDEGPNLIRVAPLAELNAEQEAKLKAAKAAQEAAEADLKVQEVELSKASLQVSLVPVNHADAALLLPRVKTLLTTRGGAEVDARTNTIIIKDVADSVQAARQLVRRLDTQTPQVYIEARIVELNSNNTEDFGIQWGGDALFSSATGNPTGLKFPSLVGLVGSADDLQQPQGGFNAPPNFAVNLPASAGLGDGGALGVQLGSLDGTFNLNV